MATVPRRLQSVLGHYRRRWKVVQAAMGIFLTLCAVVGGAGIGVLADRVLLGAPWALRIGIFVAIVAAATLLLFRRVFWPVSKRFTDERTATRLGKNFPEVAEDLVTGVELSRDQDSYGVSKGLLDNALEQIDHRSENVSWREAVPLNALLKTFAVFAILAVGMAAAYRFAPDAVKNALSRLVHRNKDFYSYTQLNVMSGDQVIRKGDELKVDFSTAGGRTVKTATVELQPVNDSFNPVGELYTMDVPVTDDAGGWTSSTMPSNALYRVKAGDARSPWYTVRAFLPPALAEKSYRVVYPTYTERGITPPRPIVGPVTVVEGAKVVIQLKPTSRGEDDPMLDCTATMTDGKNLYTLLPDASGLLVSKPLALKGNTEFKISLKDNYGLESRAPETVQIRFVPDNFPEVLITQPGGDMGRLLKTIVPVAAAARDDFGVRDIWLEYCVVRPKAGTDASAAPAPKVWKKKLLIPMNVPTLEPADVDAGKPEPEPVAGGPTKERLEGHTDFNLSTFGAVAGDTIEYRAVACDYGYRIEGTPYTEQDSVFRLSRSASYHITILSEVEHFDAEMYKLRQAIAELQRTADQQRNEANKTGQLKEDPGDKTSPAKESESREKNLQGDVKGVEEKVADSMSELSKNSMTPASLLSDLDKLMKQMDKAETGAMTDASKSLDKAGKPSKPSDQKSNLSDAQAKQNQAADELDNTAKQADRMLRRKLLEILADQAEQLAQDQDDNRKLTGDTAKNVAGRTPQELPKGDLEQLVRITTNQKGIAAAVALLNKNIEKVYRELEQEKVSDADKASEALDKMQDDRIEENATAVAGHLAENLLFSQDTRQRAIATSLQEVADILRTDNSPSGLQKELAEFIKRQKELNGGIEKLINGDVLGAEPAVPGKKPKPATRTGAMAPAAPQMGLALVAAQQRFAAPVAMNAQARINFVAAAQAPQAAAVAVPVALDGPAAPAPAASPEVKNVAGKLGDRQGVLGSDVNDFSRSVRELFKQYGIYKIEAADSADKASGEMSLAATDLPVPSLPQALDHGKKALAFLEEAAKKLEEEPPPDDPNAPPSNPDQMSPEAMMLLCKIIGQEKVLKADTGQADRTHNEPTFADRVMALARNQNRIIYDTNKLIKKLVKMPKAAKVVDLAKTEMKTSHSDLESGNAGQDTRTAQENAILILEALLKDQKGGGGGGSSGAMQAAMASAASGLGKTPGGNPGGTNGPLAPTTVDRSTFNAGRINKPGEKVGSGGDSSFPAEFRGLLNSYFDQIRKEARP